MAVVEICAVGVVEIRRDLKVLAAGVVKIPRDMVVEHTCPVPAQACNFVAEKYLVLQSLKQVAVVTAFEA